MFDGYNSLNSDSYINSCFLLEQPGASDSYLKALYDKKQCFYGVEAEYQMPFSLYFHLTEATNQPLDQFIANCVVEFSICTKPLGKPIITKVFPGKDTFNINTQDIKVDISQDDAQLLKQETYSIILKLIHTTSTYIIHSERDSVLVIR
jgi:hypothetical protein